MSQTSNTPAVHPPFDPSHPRILIFGSGSIGSFYCYILSQAIPAQNIVAVCRSNYDVASRNGFTFHSELRGKNLNVKPRVVRTVEEVVADLQSLDQPDSEKDKGLFDYIFVTVKNVAGWRSTPKIIAPAVTSPQTAVVVAANGIGIENPYREAFPQNPIITCTTYAPISQVSPGVFTHVIEELTHLGSFPADSPPHHKDSVNRLGAILKAAASSVQVHEDMQQERWSKLLLNVWNPICALARRREVDFRDSSPDALDFVRDVMLEVASIAQSEGYTNVNADRIEFLINRTAVKSPPGVEPSTMADVMAGRKMEVDTLVGNALDIAKKNGVQTPLLRSIYVLFRGLDDSCGK